MHQTRYMRVNYALLFPCSVVLSSSRALPIRVRVLEAAAEFLQEAAIPFPSHTFRCNTMMLSLLFYLPGLGGVWRLLYSQRAVQVDGSRLPHSPSNGSAAGGGVRGTA